MKYLFFLVAMVSNTQAAPLLTLQQSSGYVIATSAMYAECSLEPGHVTASILRDRSSGEWKYKTKIDQPISGEDMTQVMAWLDEAAAGPFKTTFNPCDIGTIRILANTTMAFPLLDSQDCGNRTENQHPSAAKLISWFRHVCYLEGSKR